MADGRQVDGEPEVIELKAKEVVNVQMLRVQHFIDGIDIVKIENQETYDDVYDKAKGLRKLYKEIETVKKSITQPLELAKKNAIAFFNQPLDRLETFGNGLKKTMDSYNTEQERIELEEQKKRDEAARIEKEKLEKKAQREEAKGKVDAAETTRAIAETVVSMKVAPKVEKRGTYNVNLYQCSLQDKKAFIDNCISTGRLEYLEINFSMLNKEATSTRGERKWPGIKINITRSPRMR